MNEAAITVFQSVTGQTLSQSVWKPEGDIRAVVQIVHGMAEHIACYDETAKRLNEAGILVVGHDLPGHGQNAEVLGLIGGEGFDSLVEDEHALRLSIQRNNPGVPYFLFGHSMGSFIAQNYCLKHMRGLAGVILSGTGHFAPPLVTVGLAVANLLCLVGAGRNPGKLLEAMSFAGYNKAWSPPRTQKDWISSNEQKVDSYVADPLCGFTFTNCGYRDLFRGLRNLYPQKITSMDKDVPVLLYSGANDPVGSRGAGVKLVARELQAAGMKDVTLRLYENGRHEMHNEPNREEVFRDLIDWMFSRL